MWSENETPNNQPMPKGQIGPKGPLQGPGKSGWMDGCCHVAVEEVCRWEGVDEDCQHPGQEIEGRQLCMKIFEQSQCQEWSDFDRLFLKLLIMNA